MNNHRMNRAPGWITMLLVGLAACRPDEPPPAPTVPASGALREVDSWGYQLQGIDLTTLENSAYDLLVIDYADEEGQPFTAQAIDRLHARGKIVLSYLSIGEAENYRPYWEPAWISGEGCDAEPSADAPGWLEASNPDWCGNYLVQIWDPGWQAIVMTYLDAIVAAGFDGVYLDKVDSFYTWLGEEDLGAPFAYPDAPQAMADLVTEIAARARRSDPDFIVVPQNGAEIVDYLSEEAQTRYLETIDGIAVEDTFFPPSGNQDENARYAPDEYILSILEAYQQAGLTVLAVDYVTEPDKIEQLTDSARARGFIPYAGVRALDRLAAMP